MKENNNPFDYDEIYSSSENTVKEYEDIVSDTSLADFASAGGDVSKMKNRYRKKKEGFLKRFKKKWKKLSKSKKAIYSVLMALAALVLVFAIVLSSFVIWFKIKYNYNPITTDPDLLGFDNIINEKVINIALFGVDSRDENVFTGNTDSIMILSLNTETKKVKIFSVMRDTLVPIENDDRSYCAKVNSVYATKNKDGVNKNPELAIKTLNQVFNLDISEYATVNFFGMTDIIDAVGGITATITEDELTWKGNDHPNLNGCMDEICRELGVDAKNYYIKSAGEQTLNGIQAVAYARVRHCKSVWGTRDDYGRTDRQRHVMQQLFNKAVKMEKSKYFSLVNALMPCTETSLSSSEVISLAVNILLDSPSFEQYRLPQTDMTFAGPSGYGSIVYYDLGYAAKLVHGVIYDDMTMDEYIEEHPIEKNDWYYKRNSTSGGNSQSSTTTSHSSNNSSTAQTPSNDTPTDTTPTDVPSTNTPTDTTSTDDDGDDTACEHKKTQLRNVIPATPESEGYSGDTYCTECGEQISEGKVLPRLDKDEISPPADGDGDNDKDEGEETPTA